MSNHQVQVSFTHGPAMPVESGTTLRQLLERNPEALKGIEFKVLGALVNNEFVSVEYRLETDSKVHLLGYRDSYGQRIYRHTIAFLLSKVANETFPGCDFAVEHSLCGIVKLVIAGPLFLHAFDVSGDAVCGLDEGMLISGSLFHIRLKSGDQILRKEGEQPLG